MVKIWPCISFKYDEKDTKFIFTAKSINSIDIKIVMTFFLFKKIPNTPSVNSTALKQR